MSNSLNESSDLRTLWRVIHQARPYWSNVVVIFIFASLSAPLALLAPVPLMIAVDNVIGDKSPPLFLTASLGETLTESSGAMLVVVATMVVAIAVMSQLQSVAVNLLRAHTGEKLTLGFQSDLLNHSQRLSLAYHDTKGTSDAVYRVQYDSPAFQRVIIYTIPGFFTSIITLVGMIIVMVSLDWVLALIALTISPILLVLTRRYRVELRSQWRDVKKIETVAFSVVQEVLSALRIVKAFSQEDREHERFLRQSRLGVAARIKVVYLENGFTFLTAITIALGTGMALYVGVTHVQSGILSLGQLLLVMSYLAQLYQPLQAIGQQITRIQGGLASVERAYSLLDELPDVDEKADARPLAHAAGRIEFDKVCFSYDKITPILRDITFEIPENSKVGIIGRTGAGKSTLVNLILRLYDPQSGSILLDGINIRDYKLKDLRNQFAMVLQDTILLSTTIAENIAYSRPDALMEDIIAAARSANIHDYVAQLPEGYNTQVGERGMKLSGGQRQRIAIARAFLKDAPILILDEPTSSVDIKTEGLIIEAMNRLISGRTTLMIAHRVSTLSECGMVIELEAGRLHDIRTGVMPAVNVNLCSFIW